jgi:hypothetical protein
LVIARSHRASTLLVGDGDARVAQEQLEVSARRLRWVPERARHNLARLCVGWCGRAVNCWTPRVGPTALTRKPAGISSGGDA